MKFRPGFRGGGKGGNANPPSNYPLSQCILDKNAHNLKETYCYAIKCYHKAKNLKFYYGYFNFKCHFEVNIDYSL